MSAGAGWQDYKPQGQPQDGWEDFSPSAATPAAPAPRSTTQRVQVPDMAAAAKLVNDALAARGLGARIHVPGEEAKKIQDFGVRAGQRTFQGTIGQLRDISSHPGPVGQAMREQLFPPGMNKTLAAATIGPRMIYNQARGMASDYRKDPANLVGDVATIALLHGAFGEEKLPKVAKGARAAETKPLVLSPEQERDWMAKIQKENDAYQQRKGIYHAKLSEAFDTAKEAVKAGETKYGQQLRDYFDQMTSLFDEAKQDQIEAEAKHQQKVVDIEAQNAAKTAEYERKLGELQERRELTGSQKKFGQIIQDMTKSAFNSIKREFDMRWDTLRAKNATEQLDSVAMRDEFRRLATDELSGHPEDIATFRQAIRRVVEEVTKEEAGAPPTGAPGTEPITQLVEGETGGDEPKLRPTTFQEGRRTFTALGDQAANAQGNVRRVLLKARDFVGQQLRDATARTGTLDEYNDLIKDSKRFYEDWRDRGSAFRRIMELPDMPNVVREILGAKQDRILATLDRYRKYGMSDSPIRGLVEATEKREALSKKAPTPPTLAAPPERPFNVPVKKRGVPQLPEPPQHVTELEGARKKPPSPPKWKPVPPPEPKPPKKVSRLARHVGSLAGAILGSKIGHPWIGAGIGRNVAEDIVNREKKP